MQERNDRLTFESFDLKNLFKDLQGNEQEIAKAKKFLADTISDRNMEFFTPEVLIEISRKLQDKDILAGDGILRWNNVRRSRGQQ